jgi:hypothetical protein
MKLVKFSNLLFFLLVSVSVSQEILINEVMSNNTATLEDKDGDYSDWIELFNNSDQKLNLGEYALSDDMDNLRKWIFPNFEILSHQYVVIFASGKDIKYSVSSNDSELHTNFKMSSDGETLYLSNPQCELIDQLVFPFLPTDISFGRNDDGEKNKSYFRQATPGAANGYGYKSIADPPEFSNSSKFIKNELHLILNKADRNDDIYYTLDGSEPTEISIRYISPIHITKTETIKAKTFSENKIPSRTITNTFVYDRNFSLPVIAIATNPSLLWDEDNGIYVMGPKNDLVFPYYEANFWKDIEIPIHIEFFDEQGEIQFNTDAGMKIFGGFSRAFAQKSLAIFFRKKYGAEKIEYQLFPDMPIYEFKSFLLRNSGEDWGSTHFRDALMHSLVENISIDNQAYRPTIVFLNGEYWGIYNIREKINEDYLSSHYNIDPQQVDLLEISFREMAGSNKDFVDLYSYIATHDMSNDGNYNYVSQRMDMDNFIDYQVSEIYFANMDWPGTNVRYWQSDENNIPWRWLLYDTDTGFGLWDSTAYKNNTLVFATEDTSPYWPNPHWSTLFLRLFLTNEQFKTDFINRFAGYSNTIFHPDTVLKKISIIQNNIKHEMPYHIERWGGSVSAWEDNVNILRTFAKRRIDSLRHHFMTFFNLPGFCHIEVDVYPPDGGIVKLDHQIFDKFPWNGDFFQSLPIQISAIPNSNYQFSHWEGLNDQFFASTQFKLKQNIKITAHFAEKDKICITEIYYNSNSKWLSGDWIEFYNSTDNPTDMSEWTFQDENDSHIYKFPKIFKLGSQQYVVLCNDTSSFKKYYPQVDNFLGNFTFGLDNEKDTVRLYDKNKNPVDSVRYENRPPWPIVTQGNNASICLKNLIFNSSLPQNWDICENGGTPGNKNSRKLPCQITEDEKTECSLYLEQNFPNPFNDLTFISFTLPESDYVSLIIYDILGRQLEILMNEFLQKGRHTIRCDTLTLNNINNSGVYFYLLKTKKCSKVKKMILVKGIK